MEPTTYPGRPESRSKSSVREQATRERRERKALTIGAVSKLLKDEFPDVSISKIRYLEDQRLLAPRRTRGGYRLYSPADVSRLRTILRLQRDEFLPLRVIRQELASGRAESNGGESEGFGPPRALALSDSSEQLDRAGLSDQTGVEQSELKELEDYGVLQPAKRDGEAIFDDVDREIVVAVGELRRFGVAARNLRVFRTSAEREAGLCEQVMGAALRSPNADKRRQATEALEDLAAVVSRLQHLLLMRDLRRLVD